jgi:hypothetical protein
MRQHDIVRAKILIAKTVGIIEMLINAEEPRVLKRRVVIGLSLEDPRKSLMQALLLQYDAAGHEIESLRRFVVAQPEQNLAALRMIKSMETSGASRTTERKSSGLKNIGRESLRTLKRTQKNRGALSRGVHGMFRTLIFDDHAVPIR